MTSKIFVHDDTFPEPNNKFKLDEKTFKSMVSGETGSC